MNEIEKSIHLNEVKRVIFISPHLDDAVLSCGGLINYFSQFCRVEIWTTFCGAPSIPRNSKLVNWLHEITQTKNALELIGLRKKEDKEAAQMLNA
ncbi:MAG: PIG-L family deacetylase, partial [Deltaproteobacteria bacterium]